MAAADPAVRRRAPFRLATKLTLALLALAAAMIVVVVVWLVPATTRGFVSRCDAIVARTTEIMRGITTEHTEASRRVIVDLIEHTTEARSNTLRDLPLSLYRDPEAMRTAILAQDAERGGAMRRNVDSLAREMQRRATNRIASHLTSLANELNADSIAFAGDLRHTHLLLSAGILSALIVVLGLGLFRLVVRPVAALRAATHRVALGDLSVQVAPGSADEVGALANDFAAMVEQLRQSRAELERLNHDLAHEVERKTQHLAQALADLQQSHRRLAQAARMESIGTLAGGVAHEFNNLIGGIRGCATEALGGEADAEQREALQVILRAADRASTITQQLLRFARPTIDRTERIDLTEVLTEAIGLTEPEARRRGVNVARQLGGDLCVDADGNALHQVFVNLITNALQAMPDGGTLTLCGAGSADGVEVRVVDTGIGIAPEDIDHVFEPFFTRKDRERDPAQRGSGLGLSVSYGIVQAHGGTMTVESRLGAGTTFTVRLPRRAAAPRDV